MEISDGLRWLAREPGGAEWLAELPSLVAAVGEAWGLDIGAPYDSCHVSWVAPARRGPDDVVLKVQWPHRECEHEAAALELWDGDGAVLLLEHDRARSALLLEHCDPGTHLADAPDVDPLGALIGLLPRLWKPADSQFTPVADEAAGWSEHLSARRSSADPDELHLIDAAVDLLRDLPANQGEQVLVHQDLHGDNVLAAARRPWLVIDPKPLAAEREMSVAPIVRSSELGHSRGAVVGRLDRLCAELGLDRERARGWAVAQTVAWSDGSVFAAHHLQTARWLLDA